jgi:hypothetical protein
MLENEWEFLIAEIGRDDLSATVIGVPYEAMDGWDVRIFPTLDENRVIVGINEDYLRELLHIEFVDSESRWDDMRMRVHQEAVSEIHSYFKSLGKV